MPQFLSLDLLVRPCAACLAPFVARYIRTHALRLRGQGRELAQVEREAFRPYFSPALLNAVRLVEADPLPITDPPFASLLQSVGFSFPSLAAVDAITLDDVIAARGPMPLQTLFHELIHVAQYRELGVAEFARQYAAGFLATRSYEAIPLEVCAYTLDAHFAAGLVFDAEAHVRASLPSS